MRAGHLQLSGVFEEPKITIEQITIHGHLWKITIEWLANAGHLQQRSI